jgi:hypothetical protein
VVDKTDQRLYEEKSINNIYIDLIERDKVDFNSQELPSNITERSKEKKKKKAIKNLGYKDETA